MFVKVLCVLVLASVGTEAMVCFKERSTRTLCEQRRIHAMISMVVYRGQWFPKCDTSGLFVAEQCDNIGQCFCVDVNTGVVDESTKVLGSANC